MVLGDAGYGVETGFRAAIAGLGLTYVLGVQSSASLWPPGEAPLPVPPYGRARAATHPGPARPGSTSRSRRRSWPRACRRALGGPSPGARAAGRLSTSRFAALRVRPAHRDQKRSEPWPEEWLLVEWPKGAAEPAKYWLSNLPPRTALRELVHIAKARWLIERDYQELKQEIGLGHYEGRGWRGFHHHASLCIAAYGFLVAERCLFPPRAPPHPPAARGTCATRRLPAARRRPIRPERHVPNSISTVRQHLIVGLVGALPRCPCCLQPRIHNSQMT